MRLAIMQPYFMPYIGYYQLIAAVDMFVIYDNIKYTKKGWINRNRMLLNGADAMFSIPLKKDSDKCDVVEREISESFKRDKLLNQFRGAYHSAPYFNQIFPVIETIVNNKEPNLFRFIYNSIETTCEYLDIRTEFRISSDFAVGNEFRSQDKVLTLCQAVGADTYINPIGGMGLYAKEDFNAHCIKLKFLRSSPFEYAQLGAPFVPWLSIIDVLMFNPRQVVRESVLTNYEIL